MNKKHSYQFSVLRYVHDPVTQEFINVGIVLYSREACYVRAFISSRYGRLSDAFSQEVNGTYYRKIVGHIERQVAHLNDKSQQYTLFEGLPLRIEDLVAKILPPDDSSLRFESHGAGVAADLDGELMRLYTRLVERYVKSAERESRSDNEIWNFYQRELSSLGILHHLRSKTITTPTFSYEFQHAWQNERWHPVEPVSFDLLQKHSIDDKASKWIGRMAMLKNSEELGTLYLLLGSPRGDTKLREAYENAKVNMQREIPVEHVLVEEENIGTLKSLAQEIKDHVLVEGDNGP